MIVSLSWLSEYVKINMDVEDLAEAMTMAGLEIEAVSDRYDWLNHVVVGRVIDVAPHPNADRLKCVKVDKGGETVNVVCGAPNVAKDMLAPLAVPGTVFPDGTVLKSGVIRGEHSNGMLCSEKELGISEDQTGIMALDDGVQVGDSLKDALDLSDIVFEIGLTPNRPDCLSMIGVAREIGAIQETQIKKPVVDPIASDEQLTDLTSVEIKAPDHCPRYAARLLDNIKVGPSPLWLQDRLISVGQRPINNLVDITNFVMLETGQPLHAFDFDHLGGHRIVVRTARKGEPFTTLDGKKREMNSDMLMICDGEKPVAIGGVMGGMNSEIEDATTRVLIESACFDPVSIRKTSKKLGLSTDASHRFERGVDPDGTIYALDRAAALMVELAGGRLFGGTIDQNYNPSGEKIILLGVDDTNRHLGIDLDADTVTSLLSSVGFEVVKGNKDILDVAVPSFRVDVARPEDLMEEVARLWGYNNIPVTFPDVKAEKEPVNKIQRQRKIVRDILSGFGFSEAINYSFISRLSCDRLGLSADDPRRLQVDILNPLTEDQGVMRTSLVPGMLDTMKRNNLKQSKDLKLFEIGKVFIKTGGDDLPDEKEMAIGLWTGAGSKAAWDTRERPCDFFDIKGVVEGLLDALHIEGVDFTRMPKDSCTYTRPGHTAQVFLNSRPIGLVGEIHPTALDQYGLKQKVFIFEIDLEYLVDMVSETRTARSLPKFPSTARDITIIVDRMVESKKLLDFVKDLKEAFLEDVQLFDVFEGDPIPGNKKSISFRLTYRAEDTTLEDEAINRLHKKLSDKLIDAFDASLPV